MANETPPSTAAVAGLGKGNGFEGLSVLVIGGTGGIGSALVERLVSAGAASIVVASPGGASATARHGVILEQVDVTDTASVASLAERLAEHDIGLVVNCAGVNGGSGVFAPDAVATARREMEINCFGLMNVGTVFGRALARRGGGTLVHLLSLLSHGNLPSMATYCASKAAAHSLTQALRAELCGQGVRVYAVYPTAVDTDMSLTHPGPKMSAPELAAAIVEGLQGLNDDLYPGAAAEARAALLRDPDAFARSLASTA